MMSLRLMLSVPSSIIEKYFLFHNSVTYSLFIKHKLNKLINNITTAKVSSLEQLFRVV